MRQFFKFMLATILGLFFFFFLIIVIFAVIFTGAKSDKKVELSEHSVLKIILDENIYEREPDNFLDRFTNPFNPTKQGAGLLEMRLALEKAKNDVNIKGILLDPSRVSSGYATLKELRAALSDFKKSGKFIISYGESYSEQAYYLASVADKIYLPPSGMLEFNGLESQLLFFKGTLEKLELKPEIFRVGSFKSAVEPFILEKMSDSNRVQVTSFLNSIYATYLQDVSASRNIPLDELKTISDSMLVHNADDALKYHLITNLDYFDAAETYIRTKTKTANKDDIDYSSIRSYYSRSQTDTKAGLTENKQIAVIFANGDINSGKGDEARIGSESLSAEIRKARLDEDVKAIVLRINSPGGSALASDVIWREIVLTKKAKPIIASMSDVAASGGYYIAMACDSIIAQPTTITGSIGVFGLLLNAESFLKNKLGVTTDIVKTGKFSDLGSVTRPLTSFERKVIQDEVDKIYRDFTTKAAQGRGMQVEQLTQIASGRVWSGTEAKHNHLIDAFGGLKEAIAMAGKKAGLKDDYTVVYLPEQKNFYLREIISKMGGDDEETLIKNKLGQYYPYYKTLSHIQELEGIQARLPYELTIR